MIPGACCGERVALTPHNGEVIPVSPDLATKSNSSPSPTSVSEFPRNWRGPLLFSFENVSHRLIKPAPRSSNVHGRAHSSRDSSLRLFEDSCSLTIFGIVPFNFVYSIRVVDLQDFRLILKEISEYSGGKDDDIFFEIWNSLFRRERNYFGKNEETRLSNNLDT